MYAAQVMRSVIINSIRDRVTQKRGGVWLPITLSTQIADKLTSDVETILKGQVALVSLEERDARLAQVAQMLNFGGEALREALRCGSDGTDGMLCTLPKVGSEADAGLTTASGLTVGARVKGVYRNLPKVAVSCG